MQRKGRGPKPKTEPAKASPQRRKRAPATAIANAKKDIPKTSAKGASFSLTLFLKQLEKRERVTRRKGALNAVENLQSHVGVKMAPDLRRFYELYGSHSLGCEIGMWGLWPETYFALPDARGSLSELVKSIYVEPPTIIAAFTNTIYLGSDGGGHIYFAQLHPNGSEVFIYGPGVGELKLLADSFTTFAELNDVDDQWQRFCDDEEVDVDALQDGEVDVSSASFARIRTAARALEGRVHLTGFDKSNLSSEFDDTLPAIADLKFRTTSKSLSLALFARAGWLIFALTQRAPGAGLARAKAALAQDRDADQKNPELASLAATKVYWLWRHFLLDEKTELSLLIEETLKDPSDLVRATGQLTKTLAGPDPLPAELEDLRVLRAAIVKELASPGAFKIDAKQEDEAKQETDEA